MKEECNPKKKGECRPMEGRNTSGVKSTMNMGVICFL